MKEIRCVYCNSITEDACNPYDNGLHKEYDKYTDENPRYCCKKCNYLITRTNRLLADLIHSEERPQYVAFQLKDIADYLSKNSQDIKDYYENANYRESVKHQSV